MRRAWAVIAGVLIVAVVGVTGGVAVMKVRESRAAQPPAPSFEPSEATEIVEAREIAWQPMADLMGTVFAIRSVMVRNELAGVVTHVGFDSGQIAEAGQIVLQQDETSDRADLEAVTAAVRVAEASIEQADAEIKLAEAELERLTSVQSRAIAEVEIDRARTKLDTARATRGRWAAEVDQARARVAQVEARLAKLTIRAPFRARAGMRTVQEGQYLSEGVDVVALQELTDTIYLDFAIPQEFASRATPGTIVTVTGEALGPDPVQIEVVAADSIVNNQTRNLRVRAIVDNADGALVPGMFVQVRVPIDEPKPYVVVPSMAVRRAAYANSVFVIAPDETGAPRASQRVVTLGPTVGEDVIVLDGLKVGERVAAAGSFKLHDGVKVIDGPPGGRGSNVVSGGEPSAATGG